MRFMTLTLERIYMSGFLSISFEHEIDIIPIQSICVPNLLVCQMSNENKYFCLTKKA